MQNTPVIAVLGRASTPEELGYLRNEVPVHMRWPRSKEEDWEMALVMGRKPR